MKSRFDRWSYDGPSGEEAARIQRGIDQTMKAIIADPYKDPTRREPSPTVRVVGAVEAKGPPQRGTGWAREMPLASPMPKGSFIESVVGGMIDRALGPAVPTSARRGQGG